MKITYLDHSGFAVEYQKYVLIFDWYKGKLPEFDSEKEIYVFSSHSHYDHFDRKIFELENIYSNVRYVLSADITEKSVPSKVWFVIIFTFFFPMPPVQISCVINNPIIYIHKKCYTRIRRMKCLYFQITNPIFFVGNNKPYL